MKELKSKLRIKFGKHIFVSVLTLSITPNLFTSTQTQQEFVYKIPEKLDDGWQVSSLKKKGMDEVMITKLTNQIIQGKYKGIHSMLIVKSGNLVHEAYFGGYHRDSLHKIHSITKSISSALIGIAINEKYIKGVEEPIDQFFPEFSHLFEDSRKREIKIKHILTLTSGFDWDEKSHPYSDSRNSEYNQVRSGNWIKYVLERPMRNDPGMKWEYNTGSVHLLSGILRKQTGKVTDKFAEEYLFKPLKIREYEWNKDPQGNPCTGGTHGGLRIKTRDIAKIGYVFLNDGQWKGQQVVPKEWVDVSTAVHIRPPKYNPMGFLWWRSSVVINGKRIDSIYSAGYGGQSLTLVPELNLIIVFTCWTRSRDAAILGPLLTIYNATLPRQKHGSNK